MTAVPNRGIVGPTDAELAGAAAGGDRGAFAAIYDRYADRLHDFCVGMLRDRDGAADCVQDAFCTAATSLSQLREPDKLRPWLYAIARNEALRRLRERRREKPSQELPDAVSEDPGPDTLAARTELADLIAEAAGGLSDRDRSVLELAYRHGLAGPELADALGVSPVNANRMVSRLRETVERSLGALLVSRRARRTPGGCPELAAVLDGWDGRFSVLMRKRIARHIEACPTCDEDRQRLVSPTALLAGAPVFIPAPPWLRERTLREVRLTTSSTPIGEDTADTGAADVAGTADAADDVTSEQAAGRRRPVVLMVALLVAISIASLGLTLAWLHQQDTPVTPTDVSGTAPETAGDPRPLPPTVANTTVPASTGSAAKVTSQAPVPILPPSPTPVPGAAPTAVPTVPGFAPVPSPSREASEVPTRTAVTPTSTRTAVTPTPTRTGVFAPHTPERPAGGRDDGGGGARGGGGGGR